MKFSIRTVPALTRGQTITKTQNENVDETKGK